MSEYTFKTYRVEWAAEVYTVDQYGNEFSPSEILYYKGFPTRDEAVEHLEEISYPHKYVQGRRVCKDKKIVSHEYHEVEVRYHEVLVTTETLTY